MGSDVAAGIMKKESITTSLGNHKNSQKNLSSNLQ